MLSPVYLFYGEEAYLRDQYLERFKSIIPSECRDFNLDVADGRETGVDDIVNLATTLPFLTEKRVVIVKNADFFKARRKTQGRNGSVQGELGDEGEEVSPEENIFGDLKNNQKASPKPKENALERYFDMPLESTCMVLCTDSVDRNLRVFKKVVKVGQTVEFSPLKNRELVLWIESRARQLGKIIEPGAVAKLVTAVGNNLRQMNSELEKLACFQDRTAITEDDVTLLVGRTVELSIFELVDAIGGRKTQEAIRMTREMVSDGEPVLRLLFMIARQFRLLLRAKSCTETGIPEREAAAVMQVHPYVAQKCINQARNFYFNELKIAMEKILATDLDIKTGRQEPVLALELMIVALCDQRERG